MAGMTSVRSRIGKQPTFRPKTLKLCRRDGEQAVFNNDHAPLIDPWDCTCKNFLDPMHFLQSFLSAIAWQPSLFVLRFSMCSQSPTSSERRTLHWQLTSPTSIGCEAPNLKKKKGGQSLELMHWSALQPRVSPPPFSTAKYRHKITE